MFELAEDQLKVWNDHVLATFPNEACAVVVDGRVIPVPNVADDPRSTFKISTGDIVANQPIQAVLHSHCYDIKVGYKVDPRTPSASDMKHQLNTGVWWGITATEGEGTTPILWFGKDRNEPYEGRTFIHNVADCFELVRDYYRREYNYNIGQYVRQWDWEITDASFFDDNFEKEGFTDVPLEQIAPGDVIFFGIRSEKTNHIGLYIGDDKFLHHLTHRLSEIDTLPRWHRYINRVVRRTTDAS